MHQPPTAPGLLRFSALLAGGLVVLVGLVWLIGGFRPAIDVGRPAEVGSDIELRRWVIAVEKAVYSDTTLTDTETDPLVRVWLRITNTTDATLFDLSEGMITVRVGRTELTDSKASYGQPRSGYSFDPDMTVVLPFEYTWPTPQDDPPGQIAVVVRDERQRANFVISGVWGASAAAGVVSTPCPDERTGR